MQEIVVHELTEPIYDEKEGLDDVSADQEEDLRLKAHLS
jgi:hypothetical protein